MNEKKEMYSEAMEAEHLARSERLGPYFQDNGDDWTQLAKLEQSAFHAKAARTAKRLFVKR